MIIYLVAGEASGDGLGAGLMNALQRKKPDIRFEGIGGEAMSREGLKSLFPYHELSIMGFLEVLPRIPRLLKRLRETLEDIASKQPNAVITIDSPGFAFRLAKMLKNDKRTSHIKRMHYVAPSVWAYKPERARKTARLFDLLLALFPFEVPYFEKEGLRTVATGHPLLWEPKAGDALAFRARHKLNADKPILLILPGSRAGEVKRHLPVFLQASHKLPDHQVVVLAGANVKNSIRSLAPENIKVVDSDEKHDAFAAASMAISKSGTITLELAIANVPMVVAHKVNVATAWLLRRMILIPYVSLINIALNKEIAPELLQEKCTPETIAAALIQLSSPAEMQKQKDLYAQSLEHLRAGITQSPSMIAAEAVLSCLT